MKKKSVYLIAFVLIILSSCNNKSSNSNDSSMPKVQETVMAYDFEDLIELTLDELRIKRNEVYAKRGRIFNSKDLQQHFKQVDWYNPKYDDVQEFLSEQDHDNIRKVIKAENIVKSKIIYADKPIEVSSSEVNTAIKMHKFGGVYHVPVSINGTEMFFIFDTGASTISISNTEAYFLFKHGKLSQEDIIGEQDFLDANGDVSTGTVINLKEVKLGNYLLTNVQASVVDNLEAPLLLGQSALSRFGKLEVDYQSETLILKK
jgi:aspartyl protease family protein